MTTSAREPRRTWRTIGLAGAACVACCAAPILAFLAAAGLFTVASVVAFGAAGLLAIFPTALWWNRRRRAAESCHVPATPVPVELGPRQ